MDGYSYDGTSINELQNKSSGSGIRDVRDNVRNNPQMTQQQQQIAHQQHQYQQRQLQLDEKDNPNEQFDIEELAKDISDNLNEKELFENEETEKDSEEDKLTLSIPNNLKDPLLLLIIYMILSQSSVRQLFGKYITYINPDQEGIVSTIGVLIYGIIMVGIFMLIKKLL